MRRSVLTMDLRDDPAAGLPDTHLARAVGESFQIRVPTT